MVSALCLGLFAGCATQTDDGEGDVLDGSNGGGDDVAIGFDLQDPFDIPVTDRGSTPETSTTLDAGSPVDTGSPVDVPTPPKDLGAEDAPPVEDAPFFVDVPVDTGAPVDAGSPVDTGPPCGSSETRCGEVCVDTRSSTTHCGACGNVCNETETCTMGACRAPCASPMTTCSGACVDTRSSSEHCGACGHACAMGEVCNAGSCAGTMSCAAGQLDCNSNSSDGCEVNLTASSNACRTPENLGSYCGDTSCGFLCGSTSTYTPITRTGRGSRWFRMTMQECSNCPASLSHQVVLTVPSGVDYDLFVYSACGSLIGSSRELAGVTDQLTITRSESIASSDTVDYWIEVRYYGGASCSPWTLNVRTRGRTPGSC